MSETPSLRRHPTAHVTITTTADFLCAFNFFVLQGGKYGIRLSLGAQECDVYDNVMSDNFRYGVFFYRGSDEAEVSHTNVGSSCTLCYRRCKSDIPFTAR